MAPLLHGQCESAESGAEKSGFSVRLCNSSYFKWEPEGAESVCFCPCFDPGPLHFRTRLWSSDRWCLVFLNFFFVLRFGLKALTNTASYRVQLLLWRGLYGASRHQTLKTERSGSSETQQKLKRKTKTFHSKHQQTFRGSRGLRRNSYKSCTSHRFRAGSHLPGVL